MRNIVFDIPNVLFNTFVPTPKDRFDEHTKELLDTIATAPSCANMLNDLSLNIDSDYRIVSEAFEKLSIPKEYVNVFLTGKFLRQTVRLNDVILAAHELGMKMYITGNIPMCTLVSNESLLQILDLVDGYMFSCQEHVLQPDTDFYDDLCDRYNIVPYSTMYVSDSASNIIVTRALSFNTLRIHMSAQQNHYVKKDEVIEFDGSTDKFIGIISSFVEQGR